MRGEGPHRLRRDDLQAARYLLHHADVLPGSWAALLRRRLDGHLDDQIARLYGASPDTANAMTLAASVARLLDSAPAGATSTSVCSIDGTCSCNDPKERA